jgi:hypothetical protein
MRLRESFGTLWCCELAMHRSGDRLLFALSAWKETSWSQFSAAFDEVFRDDLTRHDGQVRGPLGYLRWNAARTLDALAHCDAALEVDDRKIVVAPAVLALLPRAGLPTAIFAGARTPNMLASIKAAARPLRKSVAVTVQDTAHSFAPHTITVTADSLERLAQLSETLGYTFQEDPAAWVLADFSASLDDYLASLVWQEATEPNWRRSDFDPVQLRFGPPSQLGPEMRLSRYTHPTRGRIHYLLWRGDHCAVADPVWGRFAVLQATSLIALYYDDRRLIACIPTSTPLPRLLARALTLCSGQPAVETDVPAIRTRDSYPNFNCYESVPLDVCRAVARKLGQKQPGFFRNKEGRS